MTWSPPPAPGADGFCVSDLTNRAINVTPLSDLYSARGLRNRRGFSRSGVACSTGALNVFGRKQADWDPSSTKINLERVLTMTLSRADGHNHNHIES